MGSRKRNLCGRLSLTVATKRRLWSESGGYCQNPECAVYLFADEDSDFAEMAHIIAASRGGARDRPLIELSDQERANHDNIAVLCANCHTKADKTPNAYPIDLLRGWKRRSADDIEAVRGTPEFATRSEARLYIVQRLDENYAVFDTYGPSPERDNVARARQWRRHAVQKIIPNNAQIRRALKKNRALLSENERATAELFSIHETEFAARHVLGDWSAGGTRFPAAMTSILED